MSIFHVLCCSEMNSLMLCYKIGKLAQIPPFTAVAPEAQNNIPQAVAPEAYIPTQYRNWYNGLYTAAYLQYQHSNYNT